MSAINITNAAHMQHFGETLAPLLRAGDSLLLQGTLGAGKTTLAQAIIGRLSPANTHITSPTFTIVQTYPIRLGNTQPAECWHMDFYRVKHSSELDEIGVYDAIGVHVCIMEWPEKLGNTVPASRLDIAIDTAGGDSRQLTLALHGEMIRPELVNFIATYPLTAQAS
jgi:tRNA threonylcarbamoyladenosine biosynthesis protein TsaE